MKPCIAGTAVHQELPPVCLVLWVNLQRRPLHHVPRALLGNSPLQSTSSRQIPCGSRSVFCAPGSATPTGISSGYYGVYNESSGGTELTQYNQTVCLRGHFCDGSGLMKPCLAGQYSGNVGVATCTSCTVGQFAGPAASSCTSCVAGRFSNYPDQPCTPCAPGSFSLDQAASCTYCLQGTASNDTARNTSCPSCDAGTYAASSGMTSCFTCSPPYYTPSSSLCLMCDSVISSDGRSCTSSICPANTQFNVQTSLCELCSLSTSSSAGGRCITCPVSFYTPSVGSGCVLCDAPGLECAAGFASVKAGFWAYRVMDVVKNMSVFQTTECPSSDFCRGGPLQQVNNSVPTGSPAEVEALQQQLQASQCQPPRAQSLDNYLCGACDAGYELWNNKCVECSKPSSGLLTLAIIISFALVFFFIRSAALAASTRSRSSTTAALSIIIIYFVQTAALEIGPVSKYLTWFQIANFGIQSTSGGSGCIAPLTSQQQLLFAMIVPFIFIAEIVVVAFFHFLLSKSGAFSDVSAAPRSDSSDAPLSTRLKQFLGDFTINLYIGAIISALLFSYTGVASACLAFFGCIQVGDTKVLFQYPNIVCDSPEYKQGFMIALIMLIVYIIGLPVTMVVFLWTKWSSVQAAHRMKRSKSIAKPDGGEFHDSAADSDASAENHANEDQATAFLSRFGLLFSIYHESAWFWQCVILLRRSLFVAVASALANSTGYRFVAYLYLNLASMVIHTHVQPFKSKFLNLIETGSNIVLIAISAMLQTPAPFPTWVQVLLLLLLIMPCVALLVLVLRRNWRHVSTRAASRQSSAKPPPESHHDANGNQVQSSTTSNPFRPPHTNGDLELLVMNPMNSVSNNSNETDSMRAPIVSQSMPTSENMVEL